MGVRGRADAAEGRRYARLERVFRAEHGRVFAALVRRFGDLDLAEDAVAEAIVDAIRTCPRDGVPPNPAAWLTTTARRRALDLIRSRDYQPWHVARGHLLRRLGRVDESRAAYRSALDLTDSSAERAHLATLAE